MVIPDDLSQERDVLAGEADETSPDTSILDQPGDHPARGVARDRETDSLRRPNDGRVHADDFATRVDERAAGVAGIQRRISLDDIVDEPSRRAAQRASETTHD